MQSAGNLKDLTPAEVFLKETIMYMNAGLETTSSSIGFVLVKLL
jgi:cytochrome P450